MRLAESIRLVDQLCDRLWPGWEGTVLQVLLVTDSAESLVGTARPTADFAPLGHDTLLRREIWTRPRKFSPTLLATFPAVGGVPTIVIGSAEFRSLPDYQVYSRVADSARRSLRRELEQLDLGRQRRVAFYPVGAATALLLEETRADWKRAYAERPFALATLLSVRP